MSNYFPEIVIHNWDINEPSSPVGRRNIPGGFGFKKKLSLGCQHVIPGQYVTTSGTLDFNGPKFNIENSIVPSHAISDVEAITIHLLSSGTAISDLRFYLKENTALTRPALDIGIIPAFVQYEVSSNWQYLKTMPSGAGTRLLTIVPTSGNIFRQDGRNALYDQNDNNSSQFIYMNVVAPWGFPFGQYGICGSGSLRLALLFNYYPDEEVLVFGEP